MSWTFHRTSGLVGLLGLLQAEAALAAEVPSTPPAPPVSPTAAAGSSKVAERAASFLSTWVHACQAGTAEALESLYAPDFVGKKTIGKKTVAVPRAQWLKELRLEATATPSALLGQIHEAQVAGSSQHMLIKMQATWQAGKQRGQGARYLSVAEQGGSLRITSEQLVPGRLPAHKAPAHQAPAMSATPALPPVKYQCSWLSCPDAASERAELQRECGLSCGSDASQCAELAEMMQFSRCGMTPDVARSIDLWERSCTSAADAKSCAKAAQLLNARRAEGDLPRALRLLGCDGPPSSRVCNSELAAQVLLATANPKQVQRAVTIYLRGCGEDDSLEGNIEDCEKAAAIYRQGLLGKPDPEKATSLEDRASRIRMEEERRAVEDPRVNRHRDI